VLARIEIGPGEPGEPSGRAMRGPRGLALHDGASRLYVLNRVSNSLSVVNLVSRKATLEMPNGGFDPFPKTIRQGRGFLFDAKLGNGNASCATCHVDADRDALAWNLGVPGGEPFSVDLFGGGQFSLNAAKGPMTTQSLRGLVGTGPLHWRGDRPDFTDFNGAFDGLLGGTTVSEEDMQLYNDYIDTVRYAANPNRTLADGTPSTFDAPVAMFPQNGEATFRDTGCTDCHLDPFGSSELMFEVNFFPEHQAFKAPHLRNLYAKSGLTGWLGDLRSGVGFVHNGRFLTLIEFIVTAFFGPPPGLDLDQCVDLTGFLLCFPTGTAPAVGFAATVTATTVADPILMDRIATVLAQADDGKCDVVVKGRFDDVRHGLVYVPSEGRFRGDQQGFGPFPWSELAAMATNDAALFTVSGVAPGTGVRIGVDRDLDGVDDLDEVATSHLASYGVSTPGCCGSLSIAANSEPYSGNEFFGMKVTNAPPAAEGWLIVGVAPNLSGTSQFGVQVFVDLDSYWTSVPIVADELGNAFRSIPIADDPSLDGEHFYLQALFPDAQGPEGFVGSDALDATTFVP
ncbi:MAG TPA: hypothetical protein VKE69_09405, partial [Planctomycetota bacterium]|nr:hypothetical protein [Planctomycetota bacterium]